MTIIEDTRQQIGKHDIENAQLEGLGVKLLRSKLVLGDYADMKNLSVIVDTKQDLQECVGNICGGGKKKKNGETEHDRFRNECILAQENGIKLYVLVEQGGKIKSIEDVRSWKNPRQFGYEKAIRKEFGMPKGSDFQVELKELKSHGAKIKRGPNTGEELCKAMLTMQEKYGVEFQFCDRKECGQRIIELLGGD